MNEKIIIKKIDGVACSLVGIDKGYAIYYKGQRPPVSNGSLQCEREKMEAFYSVCKACGETKRLDVFVYSEDLSVFMCHECFEALAI